MDKICSMAALFVAERKAMLEFARKIQSRQRQIIKERGQYDGSWEIALDDALESFGLERLDPYGT